jgi:hypothetical protein
MGGCQSVFTEDDEEQTIRRLRAKKEAEEMAHYREHLKKQRGQHSVLDINGRGISR